MSDVQQEQKDTAQTQEFQGKGAGEPPAPSKTPLEIFDIFFDNINGLLAAKENLKLQALYLSLNEAYMRKWSTEANFHFTLAVSLRKRRKKLAEKS